MPRFYHPPVAGFSAKSVNKNAKKMLRMHFFYAKFYLFVYFG